MRTVIHFGVIVSFLLAFAQAPFLHVHDHDGGHGHSHGFAHVHEAGGDADGPAAQTEDHDGDARYSYWIAGDGKFPDRVAAELPEAVVMPEPIAQAERVADFVPHNHDPPWRTALKSRAPPA